MNIEQYTYTINDVFFNIKTSLQYLKVQWYLYMEPNIL